MTTRFEDTVNKITVLALLVLCITNIASQIGEYYELFGDGNEPHFSHGDAALLWWILAITFRKVFIK